ncbi:aldose epimerase family protein [Pediococcus pentosaceus]|uniref:aldose epimerase family protein n=1 Tax=Pediococcus pentosaceus TaxID=1255 RepID=UPI0018A18FA7|nr:aldose epimerase family protein [Pediococcus pentosaceus]MBF7123576.1 galactose mutarotase [Pediococcus pentosaceus]MCR1861378.1 galactose mutarotase [Pediococcus pentosaceus]
MKINIRSFDIYKKSNIKKISLINNQGIEISLLDQGALWYEFLVPNFNSQSQDNLILNFNHTTDYYKNPFYLGMLIGRTGGRISHGKFESNGETFQLPSNEGSNTLHGGKKGFHSYKWDFVTKKTDDQCSVTFYRFIPDNSDGFPGDLKVCVTYTLDNDNCVTIDYSGQTFNKPSLFNPTNHAYFKLDQTDNILHHQLKLDSNHMLEVDSEKLPTGKKISTTDTPFDFSDFNLLNTNIEALQNTTEKGIDDIYVMKNNPDVPTAILKSTESNHQLSIYSDRDGLVVFTANSFTKEMPLIDGAGHPYQGIALETQQLPDSMNHPDFKSVLVEPHEQVEYRTIYKYSQI